MTGRGMVNPYQIMLGLAADVTEPDHYQLLGLQRFEPDQEAIRNGAADANGELLKWQNSPKHFREAQRLMDEVAAARDVLLDAEQKAEYDAGLRRHLAVAVPADHQPKDPNQGSDRPAAEAGNPDDIALLARGPTVAQPQTSPENARKAIARGPNVENADEEYTLAPLDESPAAPSVPESDEEYTLAPLDESPVSPVNAGLSNCPRCQAVQPSGTVMCTSCGFDYGTGKRPTRNEAKTAKGKARSLADGSNASEVDLTGASTDSARLGEAVRLLKRMAMKGITKETDESEPVRSKGNVTPTSPERRPLARFAILGGVSVGSVCLMFSLFVFVLRPQDDFPSELRTHVPKLRQLLEDHKLEEASKHIDELRQNEPDVYGHPAIQKLEEELKAAIGDDDAHRRNFEQALIDARQNGETLDGYEKALGSLEAAGKLAVDSSER